MKKILCSTGAIIGRLNGRNITLLNQALERVNCDGYEFLMYDTWYDKLEAIEQFMKDFPVPVPVFHCEKSVGERISRNHEGDLEKALELFGINCELAGKFNAQKLVLHLWGGLDSDKDIAHNIEVYQYLRNMADRYHLGLTIENVVCNYEDPMSHMLRLAGVYPDIEFTFDTKMAEFHKQIERLYTEENRWLFAHIRHMHINDYKGGYKEWTKLKTLHIGDGQIDFERFFAFIKENGYTGDFTIEAMSVDRSGAIDFESLNRSIDRLRNLIG